MKNFNYIIFDMDGTLVDSMKYWKTLLYEYLNNMNINHIPSDVMETIKPMTMAESTAYLIKRFNLNKTTDEVIGEMDLLMANHYTNDILPKPGVVKYIQTLKKQNVTMCVASATAKHLINLCLDRWDILDCFDFILSCEDTGIGKTQPDIYLEAAKLMNSLPENTAVYEDALYAMKTAKAAGFYVIGVRDKYTQSKWDQIVDCADEVICDFHKEEEK